MQVEELRDQVRRAFADVSYSGTVQGMLAVPYSSSDDAYEMAAAFHDKAWSAVDVQDLFRHREMLFALTPAAYAAYLPAYLMAALAVEDAFAKYSADLCVYLVESLVADDGASPDRKATTSARLADLSKSQRTATIEVVQYLHKRWDVQSAQSAIGALHALG